MSFFCQHVSLGLILLAALPATAQEKAELDFLGAIGEFHDVRKMLPAYMMRQADECLRQRAEVVAGMTTPDAVARRRALVRETIVKSVGGFPARTPLNARITGTLDRGDYRIEKIIFESQPRFFVTAN